MAAAALLVHRFVLFATVVVSTSMRPSLQPGDLLLTTRMHRRSRVRLGDIVVFRSREVGTTLVKRVVGLPGDRVVFAEGGVVERNDEPLHESYAGGSGSHRGDFAVPAGHLLMLGDDREVSHDSRSWTRPFVPVSDVLGIVRFRLLPLRRRSPVSSRPSA